MTRHTPAVTPAETSPSAVRPENAGGDSPWPPDAVKSVCMVCKYVMHDGPEDRVSHGLCGGCGSGMRAKLAAEKLVRDFAKPGWLESDDFTTDVTRAFRMLS